MKSTSNRLALKFAENRKSGKKTFCAFLTLGYPDLKTTEKLLHSFEREGVDILELGIPFSDPLADGPTIQYSSEHALERGVCLADAFRILKRVRDAGNKMPVVLFTYFNPVFHYGLRRFVADSIRAGCDGLLIPDLPPDEELALRQECKRQGLAQIFLIAPTTTGKRAGFISRSSGDFIYYVSLRGVTGARAQIPKDIRRHLNALRKMTGKPLLVGFGVSSPAQASRIAAMSDGVIVGSAIIEKLRKSRGSIAPVNRFIRQMIRAVKGSR